MNLRGALRLANKAGRTGEVAISYHAAAEKMMSMGLTEADVHHALASADDGIALDDEAKKWKFYGATLDGTLFALVVRFRPNKPLLVTVHLPP